MQDDYAKTDAKGFFGFLAKTFDNKPELIYFTLIEFKEIIILLVIFQLDNFIKENSLMQKILS